MRLGMVPLLAPVLVAPTPLVLYHAVSNIRGVQFCNVLASRHLWTQIPIIRIWPGIQSWTHVASSSTAMFGAGRIEVD